MNDVQLKNNTPLFNTPLSIIVNTNNQVTDFNGDISDGDTVIRVSEATADYYMQNKERALELINQVLHKEVLDAVSKNKKGVLSRLDS